MSAAPQACGARSAAARRRCTPRLRATRASACSYSESASGARASSRASRRCWSSLDAAFRPSPQTSVGSTSGISGVAASRCTLAPLHHPDPGGRVAGRTSEKAKAAFRRPSYPVASVGFGRGASSLSPLGSRESRRRRMRVPYARLWRFPSGSRGHASTRWYLHCRYCWNLSRPDHLLSAVSHHVYRPRWTTASLRQGEPR
jgi:hypothetical protein